MLEDIFLSTWLSTSLGGYSKKRIQSLASSFTFAINIAAFFTDRKYNFCRTNENHRCTSNT